MRKLLPGVLALIALAGAPAVFAADDDMSGMEMDVIDAHGTPNDASTKTLVLPDAASDTAREHAQRGLDTANHAREGGHEFGSDTAEAARESHGAAGGDHASGDHASGDHGRGDHADPGSPGHH